MFYSILKAAPYDAQVEDMGGGCTAVMVAVASDDTRIVSVVSELSETTGICDGVCWEFAFSIDVIALDDSTEPFRTQDRQIAAGYLPAEIRPAIMDVVCQSLRALINHGNPTLIYWVTKDREPHEKALRKYHMLRETAENQGYSLLDHGTDPFGRRFWTMRRNTD
jgi:hypothetical protein